MINFEIIRLAKPTAGGKEIGDMVTETAIIRVLLNGHQLNTVITQLHYSI
jgi:hypothetical protein